MEKSLKLYLSGIHMADICFDGDEIYAAKLDTGNLVFGEMEKLTAADVQYYKDNYYLDLAYIKENHKAIADALRAGAREFAASGQIYAKHEDYENIYAGRKGANPADILFMDGDLRAFIAAGREWTSVLVQGGYEKYTPLALWDRQDISEASRPVRHLGTVMTPTRDGTALAAEVWLPSGTGPFNTILVRTPYGRLNYKNFFRYVMRGYAVCVQDVRGRGGSGGEWVPKYHEMNDGSDTIDFIAAQSWSNGRVGMIGASYLGCTQWSAAASGNPRLLALVSIVTSGDPFTDLPRKGGALASGVMAWAFSVKDRDFDSSQMNRQDWAELLKLRPLKDIPAKIFGEDIGFWSKWCAHECYDDFWASCDWYASRDKIKAPAMIVSGWYDDNGMATAQALQATENYAAKDRKVILGAWMHNSNSRREIHGIPFSNNCIRYDLDVLYQMWFDNKLKGTDNGVDRGNPVEYYMAGKNKWLNCRNWPPEQASGRRLYLSCRGGANGSGGDGRLLSRPESAEACSSYIFDPLNPAPHLIDISENEICVPEDYREMEKRNDVLVYTSDGLDEDMMLAGDVYAEFYASSTAPDTDFVVRLTDVDEAGCSIRLCDGLLRAKFRNGFDKIDLLTAGKVEKYVIRATKIAWTIKKGHRIRLQITSGAENFIFPNPNTGNNFFEDTEANICANTVYNGGAYASHITLPVLREN